MKHYQSRNSHESYAIDFEANVGFYISPSTI